VAFSKLAAPHRAVQQASAATEELPQQFQGAFEPAPSTPTRTRSPPRAAPSLQPPRGTREQGQKTKTLKDLCRSPASGTGVNQPSVNGSAGSKAAKRGAIALTSDVHATDLAGMAGKCESSSDTAAEMAAEVLVAASKRRRSDIRAVVAVDQRHQDATTAPDAPDTEAGALLPNGKGTAVHRKRQRGIAASKEIQLLTSKVVVAPGQSRIRRNAADQAWWVVK